MLLAETIKMKQSDSYTASLCVLYEECMTVLFDSLLHEPPSLPMQMKSWAGLGTRLMQHVSYDSKMTMHTY